MRRLILGLAAWAAAASLTSAPEKAPTPAPVAPAASTIGCVTCHLGLDDARVSPPAKAFADDIHAKAGFTCANCHGGDPNTEDMDAAHDAKKGFRGKPKTTDVPALCGNCHADAALIKKYNPSQRVDQLSEYKTSGHGKALAKGDATVATCISCHGAHGILPVKDSRAPVFPARVAQTCNRCHGDAKLMAEHNLPSDVYAKYTKSVHYEALTKKGDLSSPTCNSCHGNHGAAPPLVASVANVCGTCHTIFADQFKQSPHAKGFADLGLPGCVTCHENHEIMHPVDAFLSTGDEGKCGTCHESGTEGAKAAAEMYEDISALKAATDQAKAALEREAEAGMFVAKPLFELSKADEALTKARADVHMFRPTNVQATAAGGLKIAETARTEAARLARERDFRRKGLLLSLALISLSIAVLLAKIREIDRRRHV
jgi:predicted CXXCH cytochrome family protein